MSSTPYTFATIHSGYTNIDNPDELAHAIMALHQYADDLVESAHVYGQCVAYLSNAITRMNICSIHPQFCNPYATNTLRMYHDCLTSTHRLQALADKIYTLCDHTWRALSLYSYAETMTTQFMQSLITISSAVAPLPTVTGLLAVNTYEELSNKNPSLTGILTRNSTIQQNVLSGLSTRLSLSSNVSHTIQALAPLARTGEDIYQGTRLDVNEIHISQPLPQARTISDSLRNLDILTNAKIGNSYGTINIQRYTNSQGAHSWLITIPGTDGKRNSPFGWTENIQLMSSQSRDRSYAASQRAVLAAMKKAGIQHGENVTIIGHSQGGIIAASLASDRSVPYKISHIITAGSPIANHSIDTSRTWVTSIESDREIVSNLDGKNNPTRHHWLTIQGHIVDENKPQKYHNITAQSPEKVHTSSHNHELSHGMNYHIATYTDAEKLGSDELNSHKRHFSSLLDGDMDKNIYYECRISH